MREEADEATLRRATRARPEEHAPWLILADWLEEQGRVAEAERVRGTCDRRGLIVWFGTTADAAADAATADADVADAAADASATADADVADAVADAAAADTDDTDAAAADADAADDTEAADAAAAAAALTAVLLEVPDMREGLKLIQLAGRYGYSVTRVGWMRRRAGDEWEIVGAVSVVRMSGVRVLHELAAEGPGGDHRLSSVATEPEEIHRLLIRRALPANTDAWSRYCPKPDDWEGGAEK